MALATSDVAESRAGPGGIFDRAAAAAEGSFAAQFSKRSEIAA